MVKAAWKDSGEIRAISFDCYGTLIDWETGMLQSLEDEGVLEQLPVPAQELLVRRRIGIVTPAVEARVSRVGVIKAILDEIVTPVPGVV